MISKRGTITPLHEPSAQAPLPQVDTGRSRTCSSTNTPPAQMATILSPLTKKMPTHSPAIVPKLSLYRFNRPSFLVKGCSSRTTVVPGAPAYDLSESHRSSLWAESEFGKLGTARASAGRDNATASRYDRRKEVARGVIVGVEVHRDLLAMRTVAREVGQLRSVLPVLR